MKGRALGAPPRQIVGIQEARAQSARVSDEALTVDLMDGRTISVPLIWYPRLWHGTPRERNRLEISGDGTYIHWPTLDEDLTVAGLLAGRRSGERPQSLRKWLDSRKRNKPVPPTRQKRPRG
jgi:hypothetical protein